jgi:hypothetical protein
MWILIRGGINSTRKDRPEGWTVILVGAWTLTAQR